ncbi:hypothetical protein DCC39_09310 [Pueribacillus theae]|uniref:Gluconate 2-dehydrogenase subunit 3 family protein n=1 Tax=Pueribacillus theae TaxID=2171751 RepID=A0A2U1K2T6_9BACI|nr:hypothetical protein [Pueribacillus theae]PWA11826.1 hypothetical protein DCC39_09310 [Pueribacillus theae]
MSYGFIKEQYKVMLQSIADELIPPFEEMPSASEAEVVTVWAEEVLNLRHDLRQPFFRALRQLKEKESLGSQDSLAYLQENDAEAFNALGLILSGGYLLNPAIRSKLGYPGQVSRVNYDVEDTPDYMCAGLLDPVIKRGPIYRPVYHAATVRKTPTSRL